MASSESYSNIPAGAEGNPEPFTLHVPDEELSHFHSLVELSKIGPETFENLQGGKRRFGLTRDWLAKAKDAWLNDFNWRDDHEAYINSFPNFKIPIKDPECGELSIHFAGLFSAKKDAIPIIFLHGWPGSFVEFLPLLDLLRKKYTPDTLPFHAVVPSLPGYTLSAGPPLDRNFHVKDAARYMNRLMVQLGFGGGYVAQGGDVGYVIASILSGYEECKAVHGELSIHYISLSHLVCGHG
jgi:microsomal epoxide hydrolase